MATPPLLTPYTNQTLAQSLLNLIAHVGAKRNVLLGHSMGGMIAQERSRCNRRPFKA